MGTKIFGIIASAAIVVVIAFALLNFGNYHTLLPERPAKVEEVAKAIEVDTLAVDTLAVEAVDSLALVAPADTLQIEQ
ncbi:MAG: hypothetical protein IKB14_00135 [Rikenellaceae bacterium]|nr:hypothetical protein [Rikenellaceae bacterium]MBR2419101.1 hypothetical protein [Rikenellaceae bacterium]MBR3800563.1 hypothetical protein [Rikenellaceae bacterium]